MPNWTILLLLLLSAAAGGFLLAWSIYRAQKDRQSETDRQTTQAISKMKEEKLELIDRINQLYQEKHQVETEAAQERNENDELTEQLKRSIVMLNNELKSLKDQKSRKGRKGPKS